MSYLGFIHRFWVKFIYPSFVKPGISHLLDKTMSDQREIVNGSLLKENVGKSVSIVLKLVGNYAASKLKARTTDDYTVSVLLSKPLPSSPTNWMEVIGVPENVDTIRAEEVILFENAGENFDATVYNSLMQILKQSSDMYALG